MDTEAIDNFYTDYIIPDEYHNPLPKQEIISIDFEVEENHVIPKSVEQQVFIEDVIID